MKFFDVRHHRIRKPSVFVGPNVNENPKNRRFQKSLLWRAFLKRCVFGDRFKRKYWTNLFKYIFFLLFFCLLLHRLAVSIRLPFYVVVLIQVNNWEIQHHSTVCCCGLDDILYFGTLGLSHVGSII